MNWISKFSETNGAFIIDLVTSHNTETSTSISTNEKPRISHFRIAILSYDIYVLCGEWLPTFLANTYLFTGKRHRHIPAQRPTEKT
jgi:hypothetical protein